MQSSHWVYSITLRFHVSDSKTDFNWQLRKTQLMPFLYCQKILLIIQQEIHTIKITPWNRIKHIFKTVKILPKPAGTVLKTDKSVYLKTLLLI